MKLNIDYIIRLLFGVYIDNVKKENQPRQGIFLRSYFKAWHHLLDRIILVPVVCPLDVVEQNIQDSWKSNQLPR